MTRNFKKLLSTVAMAGFLGAGCLGGAPASSVNTDPVTTPTGSTPDPNAPATPIANDPTDPSNANNTSSGGTNGTFDHMDDNTTDPFQVLARIQQEGPPEVATRMHSCAKMKFSTMGNVLNSMAPGSITYGKPALTDFSPNGLYVNGGGALGKPDYTNRIAETTQLSTAGAVRTYDIMVALAPKIISTMPTNTRCAKGGTAAAMFGTDGMCTLQGISCITGSPATQAQKDLCDSAVSSNTTDMVGTNTVGQIIAVASLASAAHSCE
jgi:hypothetical protein